MASAALSRPGLLAAASTGARAPSCRAQAMASLAAPGAPGGPRRVAGLAISAAALAPLLGSLPARAEEAGSAFEEAAAALEVAAAAVPVPEIVVAPESLDDTFLLLLGGAVALTFLGASVALLLSRGYAGDVAPEKALEAVEEGKAVLLDVRTGREKREDGAPAVKPAARGQTALVSVPFLKSIGGDEFEEDDDFAEKVLASKGLDLGAGTIVLDSEGSADVAVAAAKILTAAGVKNVQVVKGGAEAWKEAELPWKEPLLALPSLDGESLENLRGTIMSTVEDTQKSLPAALAVTAAAAAAVAVVIEAEALIQLAASVAAGQFFFSKLLFAKDREQTLAQLKALVTKTATDKDEAGLVDTTVVKASAAEPAAPAAPAPVVEAVATEPVAPAPAVEAVAAEPAAPAPAATNGAAMNMSSTDLPYANRPLSPYTMYPDLKPPSSPMPSPPVSPKTEARAISTDLPRTDRPLSPYSAYPELKPPTSPTPSRPTPLVT